MSQNRSSKQLVASNDYLHILESYWNGRPQTAMERLSQVIAEDPDHVDRFRLYRMWIDVLAQQNERTALYSLIEHLHTRSIIEPEANSTYVALRGIAYLEIDDFAAATLCFKSIQAINSCDYCHELTYLVSHRVSKSMPYSPLVGRLNQLSDYFHLKSVGIIAQQRKHLPLLANVAKRVSRFLKVSPLLDELQLHTCIDHHVYDQAAECATKLLSMFPGNIDYYVYAAYSYLECGETALAAEILDKAISMGADADIDVLSLLVQSVDRLTTSGHASPLNHKVVRHSAKLKNLMNEMGFGDFQSEDQTAERESTEPALWMLKLNEPDFYHWSTAQRRQAKVINKTISSRAKIGDLVFLVGADYQSRKSWRLAGVYQVASTPEWKPLDGHCANLNLIDTLTPSVPFDVRFDSEEKIESGVIELDHDSLDSITHALREFGDEHASSISESIQNLKMSS